jgi:hypothetical protein
MFGLDTDVIHAGWKPEQAVLPSVIGDHALLGSEDSFSVDIGYFCSANTRADDRCAIAVDDAARDHTCCCEFQTNVS